MTDNHMIERVARVLANHAADGAEGWDDLSYVRKVFFCVVAYEAIEVMRVPTETMLIAARNWSQAKYGKPVGNDGATGCWQAMIDEALKS